MANADACLGERLKIENLSQGGDIFEWDFCEGDLMNTPMSKPYNIPGINIPYGSSFVKAGNKWYAFICSAAGNSIFRIDFGQKLTNEPLMVTDLGSFGGLISVPQDLKVIEYEGEYFVFVNNNSANRLVGISLGSNIENTNGIASVLLNGTAFGNGGIDVFFDGTQWIVALTNNFNITLVNVGNQLSGGLTTISVNSASPTSDVRGIGDVKFVKQDNEWFAFMVGFDSQSIHRWSFGTDVFSNPSDFKLTSQLLTGVNPYGLVVEKDLGQWTIFVATIQGKLERISLGTNLQNDIEVETDLGNVGGLSNTLKMDIAISDSRWVAIANNWNSQSYYLISFPQGACGFDQQFSYDENPDPHTQVAGLHYITLYSSYGNGTKGIMSKSVLTSSDPAPTIDILSSSICANTTSQFQASSDQILTAYDWTFGLLGQSSLPSPSVNLSDDPVNVSLEIQSVNGCSNFIKKTISIYDPPVATFEIPSGLICTNNEFVFVNNTDDSFDGYLSYQWSVDDQDVSTERNLEYTFIAEGTKEIKLITSIPGCSDQSIETIPQVFSGPTVDFSFANTCEDQQVTFTNLTTGGVSEYHWQFSDGSSSTAVNTSKTFADFGEFDVFLSATNEAGCNNTNVKTIKIYSKPQPSFDISSPPFSCTGSATPFVNASINTDGVIIQYLWNFGDIIDNTASVESPSHTYTEAKNYTVSLSATTEFGCTESVEKVIAIAQAPSAAFTHTSSCLDIPVVFESTGTGIKSYFWETGAVYYENANPTHTYRNAGDYSMKLSVVGNNDCVSKASQAISVPQRLIPNFTVAKNCVNRDAIFTDITTGSEEVVSHAWKFANEGNSTGSTATFTFGSSGQRNVTLKVTTLSGCSYTTTKVVDVLQLPEASFTESPETGAAPLTVKFMNTSSGATSYLWRFSDSNTISTEASPEYIFNEIGTFNAELTATNSAGCDDIFTKSVTTAFPLPDVALDVFNISENADGTFKVIVTIQNKGNTVLKDLPVQLDLSGQVAVRETIKGPINPSAYYNLILGYGIEKAGLSFMCARIFLENDVLLDNNMICTDFNSETNIFPAHPNPAVDNLKVEWVSPSDEVVILSLMDPLGKEVAQAEVVSSKGFNQQIFNVSQVNSRLLILVVKTARKTETQKIFLNGR